MSIATRIESIEEHIGNAYDELQGLGADLTNVNKNIENISMVLDDIYDSMPQVSGEGTSLTLEDTRVGKIKSTLKGNTSQDGTPTPTTPIPVNVVSGDNEINVCGKNLFDSSTFSLKAYSGTNNSARCCQSQAVPLKAGRYVFTTNLDLSVYDYKCDVLGEPPQTVSTETYIINSGFITNVNTWTLNLSQAQEGYLGILIRKKDNTNLDLETIKGFKFQLEKTSATSYEPYQGNTYNIDLPVENLFDKSTNIISNKGLTTTGGTFDSDTVSIKDFLEVQPNTTYTYSGYDDTSVRKRVCMYSSNSEASFLQESSGTNATLTFTTTSTTKYIRFQFKTSEINNIQLEKGSKQNAFTPYGTTPIELCKIGNYQDYIYKDNGKWYKYNAIGKHTFTGGTGENWERYNTSSGHYRYRKYFLGLPKIASAGTQSPLFSNLFEGKTPNQTYTGTTGLSFDNNQENFLFLCYESDSTDTLEKFNTWIASHNVELYYPLATPTNTEITYQPLIDQLNLLEKAMSKDGQTNISQVNNDLPFIISASALKEWQESTSLNSTLSMANPLSLGNTLNTQENDIQPIEVDNIEPLEEEENE